METNIQGLSRLSALQAVELSQMEVEVETAEMEREENRRVHERREAALQNCTQGEWNSTKHIRKKVCAPSDSF